MKRSTVAQHRTYGGEQKPCLGGCGAITRDPSRMCPTCAFLYGGATQEPPEHDDYLHGLGAGEWVNKGGIRVWVPRTKPRPAPKNCGTESGYYHHLRTRREKACDACRNAHAVAERLRAADKRIARLRVAEQGQERRVA